MIILFFLASAAAFRTANSRKVGLLVTTLLCLVDLALVKLSASVGLIPDEEAVVSVF